jgi:hypothetical protein
MDNKLSVDGFSIDVVLAGVWFIRIHQVMLKEELPMTITQVRERHQPQMINFGPDPDEREIPMTIQPDDARAN